MHNMHHLQIAAPVEPEKLLSPGIKMPRVAFSTLGCKVNGSETESFITQFLQRGYQIVPFEDEAEVYVINTCTVTHVADRKSRQEIRRAGRLNSTALVAATGCYVSIANRDLDDLLSGNLLIVHNREKESLVERVEAELALRQSCTAGAMHSRSLHPPPLPRGRGTAPVPLLPTAVGADAQRTRATLKVQDGCNMGCSFCIIPRARGGPRSVLLNDAVTAAQRLEAHGYNEIVLTGILLGSYGHDLPDRPTLATLIARLLAETSRLHIRISSLEPQDLHRDCLDLWHNPRLCSHLHLPLQSGSNRILAAMRRPYDVRFYEDLVTRIRHAVSDVAITTDIMVGFPGEGEEEFAATLALAERADFAGIHVFRYSARPGTPAARLPNQIVESSKAERSERLRTLAIQGRARFHARFAGSTLPVLWERRQDGIWHGITANYLQVYTNHPGDLHNQLVPCRLTIPYGDGIWAELPPGSDFTSQDLSATP